MSHDESAGLVAGYVLSALDADELREFEAHLDTCPDCRTGVAEMRPLVDALAVMKPSSIETSAVDSSAIDPAGTDTSAIDDEPGPSEALRQRILESARAEPKTSRTVEPDKGGNSAPRPPAPWWRRPVLWPLPVAAVITALAVAVAVLSVWGSQTDGDLSSAQRRLDLTYDGLEIMAQAEQWWRFDGSSSAPGIAGTLAYSEEHGVACLLVWGLSEGDELVYQARFTGADGRTAERRMWRYDNAMWLILEGDPNLLQKLEIVLSPGKTVPGPEKPAVIDVPLTSS